MEASDWIIVGVLALLVLTGAAVQTYATWFSEVPKDFYITYTLNKAAEEVLTKFPRPDDQAEFIRTAFMPLYEDPKGRVRQAVEAKLRTAAKYRGPDTMYVVEQMEQDMGEEGAVIVRSVEKAVQVGRKLGLDTMIIGEVKKYHDDDAQTEVSFTLTMVNVKEKQATHEANVHARLSKSFFSLEYYRLRLGQTSAIIRIIFWVILAAGLPFLTYPLLLLLFRKESNAVNMAVLITYTVLGLLFALALNGLAFSAIWAILYIVILAAGFFYYLSVLNALQESD